MGQVKEVNEMVRWLLCIESIKFFGIESSKFQIPTPKIKILRQTRGPTKKVSKPMFRVKFEKNSVKKIKF